VGDTFREEKVVSAQGWAMSQGQHIELAIAESNLFLQLAALGLAGPLFGTRLLPIGTLYDPFIKRGQDALNYACYQDARFILVTTPSGIALAPEGSAHQSVGEPLNGPAQPGLASFEPAYADELAVLLHWAFEEIQCEEGQSVYFRLSTRPIDQLRQRAGGGWVGKGRSSPVIFRIKWRSLPRLHWRAAIRFPVRQFHPVRFSPRHFTPKRPRFANRQPTADSGDVALTPSLTDRNNEDHCRMPTCGPRSAESPGQRLAALVWQIHLLHGAQTRLVQNAAIAGDPPGTLSRLGTERIQGQCAALLKITQEIPVRLQACHGGQRGEPGRGSPGILLRL